MHSNFATSLETLYMQYYLFYIYYNYLKIHLPDSLVIRNNLLRKLANSKWGTNASTIKTTALTLCYSVTEYAAPVWWRSKHTHLLDPELNHACRANTGCLRPTNVEDFYLLAGIAPSNIRRDVCARIERAKQVKNNHTACLDIHPQQITWNLDFVSYLQSSSPFSVTKS